MRHLPLALLLAACGTRAVPPSAEADAGTDRVDAGGPANCDRTRLLEQLAGGDAQDCGFFQGVACCDSHFPGDAYADGGDGGLWGGVNCALAAQDANRPFTLDVQTLGGVDEGGDDTFVRGAFGNSYVLSAIGGEVNGLWEQTCDGFAADPTGKTGLVCVAPGPTRLLCCQPAGSCR